MAFKKEFSLPKPDTRLVIFGDVVFKLKYKMSSSDDLSQSDTELIKGPVIQWDILRITKRILKHQYEHNQMFPIRSDTVVLFPGTTLWSTGRKLQFIENNKILSVHPNTIIIVVHLIKHDECCSMDKCELKSSVIHNRKRILEDTVSNSDTDQYLLPISKRSKHQNLHIEANFQDTSSSIVHQSSFDELPVGSVWSMMYGYIIKPMLKIFHYE